MSAVLFATTGSAWAADVITEPAPTPPVAVSVYDWSGPYVGVQAGFGWADLDDDEGVNFFDGDGSIDLDGGFVGALAGYNFQWNNVVLGVEGDINKAWMDEDFDFAGGDADVEIDWFGSVRGRLGYAWDRTLFFGTAGVAFTQVDMNLDEFDFSDDDSFTGWTAGIGVEHAFRDNWLVRGEYRYYDFGDGTFGDPAFGEGDLDLSMHTVSVGLTYKF